MRSVLCFIALMCGVSEALQRIVHIHAPAFKQNVSKIIASFGMRGKSLALSFQTSTIGVKICAPPGAGGNIAYLMVYDHAKWITKNPEASFDELATEGRVAPETANNAAAGGAVVAMITLGIPSDAVKAIIIGALFIQGLSSGPSQMIDKSDTFWFVAGALVMTNFFLLIFGVVGYLMKHYNWLLCLVILGVIVSRLLEDNWRRAIILRESLPQFFAGTLKSPPLLVFFVTGILIFVSQTPLWSGVTKHLSRKALL
nr:tripartite tricarboxylate transporter permease [Puniceibacterium antarcticum]